MNNPVALGKKYAFVGLAFLIGAIMIAPSLYFHFYDTAYRGAEMFMSDAEDFYLAQVREIYDGELNLGNAYYKDLKKVPYVQQPLLPLIQAGLARLLGVLPQVVNIVAKFIFPFLATMLVYWFWFTLAGRRAAALLMTTFIMCIPVTVAFLDPGILSSFLLYRNLSGVDLQFLLFARPINPQISVFFVFGYLLTMYQFVFLSASKRWGAAAAIILGLSFYTYFFAFSFIAVVSAVLFFYFILCHDWVRFRRLLTLGTISFLIGIPYVVNVFRVLQDPIHTQVASHLGTLHSRIFVFSRVWWIVTILFLLFYRSKDHFRIFILAILAALFILTNQQLITGVTVPIPSHYHWYYVAPFGGAILLFTILRFLEQRLAKWKPSRLYIHTLEVGLALFFIFAAIIFQKRSYVDQWPAAVQKQKYMDVVTWADQTVKDQSVFFGNSIFSHLVPIYTAHDVYWHSGAMDYLVSEDRLAHGYYIQLFLRGVSGEDIRVFLQDNTNRNEAGSLIFGQQYRVSHGCYGCFPSEVTNGLVQGYKRFLSQDFVTQIRTYPIDYVVWDRMSDPTWRLDRFFKNVVYNQDGIVVYTTS